MGIIESTGLNGFPNSACVRVGAADHRIARPRHFLLLHGVPGVPVCAGHAEQLLDLPARICRLAKQLRTTAANAIMRSVTGIQKPR